MSVSWFLSALTIVLLVLLVAVACYLGYREHGWGVVIGFLVVTIVWVAIIWTGSLEMW